MLWICVLLPALPLEVFTRAQTPEDAARPFAVGSGGHYPRVVAANIAADDAVVRPGQLVSAALALAPGLVLRDRDPPAEAAALAALAAWATQFTPAVSLAPPDAVLAEIGGSLRLFGGLSRLAAHFARGAHGLGFGARLAIAPTPTAALLFARAGRTAALTDPAALPRALAPLPLAHLDLDAATLATLNAAGITTFGAACALPRDAFARRFGAGLVAMLERAQGQRADPRLPFVPPPRYRGRLELPAAVESVEALAFALNRLVVELAGWLLGRGLGVLELSLSLAHERHAVRHVAPSAPAANAAPAGRLGGSPSAPTPPSGLPTTEVRFALAAPAREIAHLTTVLRERLARVELPAPVVAIALASETTAALAGRNLGLLPGDEAQAGIPLFDRLRARLGDAAVTQVRARAEHRPERAWKSEVTSHSASARTKPTGRRAGTVSDSVLPPRPAWLLAEPAPLGQEVAAGRWTLLEGPERIESGWWDGTDIRRDYFVAENPQGARVWIYRDSRYGADGEWFLHGLFA
jgi:protein ImuB